MEWVRDHIGVQEYDNLKAASILVIRWRKADKDELYTQMKSELARLENCRKQGLTTRLDFDLPKVREMQEAAMTQVKAYKDT